MTFFFFFFFFDFLKTQMHILALMMLHCDQHTFCVYKGSIITEPPRDKTNKVSVRPAKTQISLGFRPV